MSVLRNLDCLSLVVCSNTTLLKLQTVLFLFFSKFCTSKSGVRLIYGCGLYTDVYGITAFYLTEIIMNIASRATVLELSKINNIIMLIALNTCH